jgi:hypothetical protein
MASTAEPVPATGGRWAQQTWFARFVVILAVASLAFEQSPANEAVRANLAFTVLDHTGNAIVVGLAVLGITLVIEGVPGVLITAGLHLNPTLARRLMRKADRQAAAAGEPPAPQSPAPRKVTFGSAMTDVGIALGVGAGLVVVKRRWTDPTRTFRQDLKTCAVACLIVAVVSGIIGWLVAGGIFWAEKVGLERPAELIVDYATDWRFWVVVIVVIQAISFIGGRIKASRERSAYVPKHLARAERSDDRDTIIDLRDAHVGQPEDRAEDGGVSSVPSRG